ncbi:MAG: universal stress protein [Pseudomonadota bacterium]
MQRFKNIAVICDEDSEAQAALNRAQELAIANGATVTLLHVIDTSPGDLARILSSLPTARSTEIADQIKAYHADRLADLAKPMLKAGVTAQTKLLEGTAFIEIIKHVMINKHDLVIKGVHDEGSDAGLLSKGYDLHLLRKCPCPVWMVKDTDAPSSGNILAAVDPATDDETRAGLNKMVMEMSTSLAAIDKAHLHIVNVWHLQEEHLLRSGRFAISKPEIDSILGKEEAASRARFDDLLKDFPETDSPRTTCHIKGLAADAIPAYAAEHGIDTIVMGTVGRTGISGLFIGNTAEAILNTVNCTVLAVKPPGFRSPVASAT